MVFLVVEYMQHGFIIMVATYQEWWNRGAAWA